MRVLSVVFLGGAIAFAPPSAFASNIGTSYSLSRTPATEGYPASGGQSLSLSGSWDASETLSIDPNLSMYKAYATTDASGVVTPGTASWTLGLGAGYTWSDHWVFGVAGSFAPATTGMNATTLGLENEKGQGIDVHGTLSDKSGSQGAELSVSYDSAGDSSVEWGVALAVPVSRYTTTQTFAPDAGNTENPKFVNLAQKKCAVAAQKSAPPSDLCKTLAAMSKTQGDFIFEVPLNVNLNLTLWEFSGVSLGVTKYIYSKEPSEVGYFTLTSANRKAAQSAVDKAPKAAADRTSAMSFGSGIATGSTDTAVSLSLSHRFSAWKVGVTMAHTAYREEQGGNWSVSGKVYLKLNKTWRVGVNASDQRDTDSTGANTQSFSAGGNLRFSF
ncbi:MAG: hypothetical protein EXR79_06715 [Myxococcales bacterium]|nr:hypothetical protein [Myxococcales bacterium]